MEERDVKIGRAVHLINLYGQDGPFYSGIIISNVIQICGEPGVRIRYCDNSTSEKYLKNVRLIQAGDHFYGR